PGLAAVSGFVEAGEGAFADGHDDGGRGVQGLDAAEVEMLGIGRGGATLPSSAVVGGAEDGAFGAGGPGDAVAEGVDAAEVGGGGGGFDLPLRGGGDGDEQNGKDEGRAHLVESVRPHLKGRSRFPPGMTNLLSSGARGFGVCWSRRGIGRGDGMRITKSFGVVGVAAGLVVM